MDSGNSSCRFRENNGLTRERHQPKVGLIRTANPIRDVFKVQSLHSPLSERVTSLWVVVAQPEWIHRQAFTRLRRATYFLLRGQEKVGKEKATPKRWSPGILPCDCAAGLRGFADSTSVCWQRTGRDPSRPPCGPFLRPAATAYGARIARILRARAKSRSRSRSRSQSQSPPSACGTFPRYAGEGRE